jgi:predicted nucleic acid-binding protein
VPYFYVDSSALVKLVLAESESAALERWAITNREYLVSSDLARAEVMRVVRRRVPDMAIRARDLLESIPLLELTTRMYEQAGLLEPDSLRTLDALHLACALSLGDELDGIVTYDDRLAVAAGFMGVRTVASA